jgi:hypothetical protein
MASRFAGTFALLLGLTVAGGASSTPLWVSAPPSPPPLTGKLPPQIAATISALQQFGANGTAAGIAYVENYAHPNDNGGGTFVWLPAAKGQPDNCITFAARGASTGLWQRQLNGTPFNADMCGTGNADDTPAIQAAFRVCAHDQLPLVFSSRIYKLSGGLDVPAACAFHGAGRYSFYGTLATTFDFRAAPASDANLMSIVGDPAFGTYGPGSGFGNFMILDDYKVPRTAGLYISRISNLYAENISVYRVMGTGIFLGQEQEATYRGLYISESGSPTAAELDIDGENSNGRDYVSTTTSIYDSYVEIAGRLGTRCGMAINRNSVLSIIGGVSEANGNLICVANKPAKVMSVTTLLIEHVDMEAPSAQSSCVTVGDGWAGRPGRGVTMMRLVGNVCIPATTNGAAAFRISNTDGFFAQSNYVNSFPHQMYFDIGGANTDLSLGLNGNDGEPTAYVTMNGVPRGDAVLGQPWAMDNPRGATAAH